MAETTQPLHTLLASWCSLGPSVSSHREPWRPLLLEVFSVGTPKERERSVISFHVPSFPYHPLGPRSSPKATRALHLSSESYVPLQESSWNASALPRGLEK